MTLGNLLAFSPQLWLLAGALAAAALARRRREAARAEDAIVASGAIALSGVALLTQAKATITIFSGVYLVDRLSVFADALILSAALLALLLRSGGIARLDDSRSGTAWLLLATLGATIAASAANIVSLAAGLELLALSTALLLPRGRRARPFDSPMRSLLPLSLATTAVLWLGLLLLYALSGHSGLEAVGRAIAHRPASDPVLLGALALTVGGLALKLGILPAPFGSVLFARNATLFSVAFAGSVVPVSLFVALLRLLPVFGGLAISAAILLAILAAASMTVGTLLAMSQTTIRPLLAWSAVAQGGYGLAGLVGLRHGGVTAVLIFLVALAATTLAVTGALLLYERLHHTDRLEDLAGMATSAPRLALVLSLGLASAMGAPPLIGFFGRLLVLQAAADAGFSWLSVLGLATTVVGAVASLRVIRTLYVEPPRFELERSRLSRAAAVGLAAAAVGVAFLGVLLGPLSAAGQVAGRAILR